MALIGCDRIPEEGTIVYDVDYPKADEVPTGPALVLEEVEAVELALAQQALALEVAAMIQTTPRLATPSQNLVALPM